MASEPQISVIQGPSSREDWLESRRVAESELPVMSAEEREFAHKLNIPEIEFRRSKLALDLGRRRAEAKARQLAQFAERTLEKRPPHRLLRIAWEPSHLRWFLTLEMGGREYGIPLAGEQVDDALDAHILRAETALRREILEGVGLAAHGGRS